MGHEEKYGTVHLTPLGTTCLQGFTGQPPGGQGGIAQTAVAFDERTCLIGAMYFESNRASCDGLMAVGTVVMNLWASASGRTRRRRHFRGRTLQAD
jgi:hypothetical protein